MTTLGDELSQDKLARLTYNTVSRGDVFRLTLTPADGITPKDGDTSRDKYFVVLGFDGKGKIYGGVVINSEINQRLLQSIQILYMPIKAEKYSFLRHDSYVNCSHLVCIALDRFTGGKYLGKIDEFDTSLIIGTVKMNPRVNKDQLARYGI